MDLDPYEEEEKMRKVGIFFHRLVINIFCAIILVIVVGAACSCAAKISDVSASNPWFNAIENAMKGVTK